MLIPGTDEECCTVDDLIAHLKRFPGGTPVVYRCCSDWAMLTVDQVNLSNADPGANGHGALVVRNGQISDYYPFLQWPSGETPQLIVAVTFPGY